MRKDEKKGKAYRIEAMERMEVELGTTWKNEEKIKVKNMLSKKIKARLSKINDRVIDFVEKENFEELAVISKSRWKKNENLKNWQLEVRPDMWMKIGELAVKGKSRPWFKKKKLKR